VTHNAAQPMWQPERWGFSSKAERNVRDLSHASLLVFAVTAVATGILACISLSSEFGIGASSSFIVVAVLFPLLCGWLAKERWRAKRLEDRIDTQQMNLASAGSPSQCGDNTPAGLLIISPDLRICFANRAYLEGTLQEPEEVLAWKIKDVLSVEGIEEKAKALLERSDPAASCCFNALIRAGFAAERSVHITMTRIAPRQGEDRVLVVVEDLLQGRSARRDLPVEGYIC
jgi:PAS domain-containing protein